MPPPPKPPQKEGYTGEWGEYQFNEKDITVTAVYSPILYEARFVAEDNVVCTLHYTVEMEQLTSPEVPEKAGYEAGRWENYKLTAGGISVNAIYDTPKTYLLSFVNTQTETAVPADMVVPYDDEYGMPDLECLGYSFLGWYTQEVDGDRIFTHDNVRITENQTLYARWQSDVVYTLNEGGDGYTVTDKSPFQKDEITILSSYQGKPVTKIGRGALTYGTFKEVHIPNTVTTIEQAAFQWCYNLTSLHIPVGVTNIQTTITSYCYDLASITVEEGNPVYYSDNNCLIERESKTLLIGCQTSVLPTDGSLYYIGASAFMFCEKLTEISLPDGILGIGNDAFAACSNLTNINVPDTVTSIGKYAFSNCERLETIFIPDSVDYISESAFYKCQALTIYCQAESKPAGWHYEWNDSNRPVVWHYEETV